MRQHTPIDCVIPLAFVSDFKFQGLQIIAPLTKEKLIDKELKGKGHYPAGSLSTILLKGRLAIQTAQNKDDLTKV